MTSGVSLRQYCQVYVKLRLQQKIKKVPKALALDTDKSILSRFEIETICIDYRGKLQICQLKTRTVQNKWRRSS